MKHSFVAVLIFCLMTQGAFAACYSADQYRAEQAIRFHTKLMVVGLYCKNILKQDTYGVYQDFTRRNQNVIRTEENVLISYFKKSGTGGERALHSLRTDLANKMSIQAGQSPVGFCRSYANSLQQAKGMIPSAFQRWIEQISLQSPYPSTQNFCGAAQRAK